MSTLFNTFVAPLNINDIENGTCVNLNKTIDKWLRTINGREVSRSQPTVAETAIHGYGHSARGSVVLVTVTAELND